MTNKWSLIVNKGENVTHIKGRLLEQAVILLIASLFIMETSLKEKNLLPQGASPSLSKFFPLRAVS